MKSFFLVAEGEELLVRTLTQELLSIQEKLMKLQNTLEKKNQYLVKLDIRNLKSQIQKK